MSKTGKKVAKKILSSFGMEVNKAEASDPVIDQDQLFNKIYEECKPYTMTSRERMFALYQAVKYVVEAGIAGDFVECGVWRGGSSMMICSTLKHLNVTDKKLYMYDTYSGMPEPTEVDGRVSGKGAHAKEKWSKGKKEDHNGWCYASLDEVKENMRKTGYPFEQIEFVQGKVQDTIPAKLPNNICVLRLDTDLYESTKHELENLYPILENKGVLIIDDYGSWAGSKKATDEYFEGKPILLNRIDKPGRIAMKV